MSTLTLPETITNGTTLDATEVQSNFTTIESFVNTDVVTVDGGKSFTGAVTLPAASPTTDNHATRKKYVDDKTWDAAHLQDNAVTTAKILDANVTTAKLADASVTTAKIANSNVTDAKMANTTYANIKGIALYNLCGRASASVLQAIPNNSGGTIIEFDTESYDYGNMHSTSSNKGNFVMPSAGVVHFDTAIPFDVSATGYRRVRIEQYSSGGTFKDVVGEWSVDAGDSASSLLTGACGGDVLVAAGDIIQVRVVQTSGGDLDTLLTVAGGPRFSWHYVRLS